MKTEMLRIKRAGLMFAVLVLTLAASTAGAITVCRHPFIQSQTTNSVVIVWRTIKEGDIRPYRGFIKYSEDESLANTLETQENLKVTTDETGNGVQHVATITGLKPDTTYHYQVLSDEKVELGNGTFRTASAKNRFSFLVLGDSGKGDRRDDGQWGVAERIREYAGNCDLGIGMGDHVQNESQAHDYQRYFFDYYDTWLRSIPFYPVRGNHEYDWEVEPWSGYRTVNFDLAFVLPNANPKKSYEYGRPLKYGEPEVYYRVDYGNAIFLTLDVPADSVVRMYGVRPMSCRTWMEGSPQHDWLVRELKAARERIDRGEKDWLFVYFHVGPYTYYGHGNKPDIEKALVPYFEKYKVDVVFNGHTHAYERTWPLKERRKVEPGQGVVYLTTGGAGPSFYDRRKGATFLEETLLAHHEETRHFVLVDIDGRKLRLRAIGWNGNILDEFQYEKPGVAAK